LDGKPEGKRAPGRPMAKFEYVGMGFREIVWEGVDRKHLGQEMDQWRATVNTVIHIWVP
jgi:hypothetical protein